VNPPFDLAGRLEFPAAVAIPEAYGDRASSTGAAFTVATVIAAVLGLATIVVLWRLYLDARRGDAAQGRIALSRSTYAYTHALMVAGAVIVAVGTALVLADPWETADAAAIATVLGGPAVYLVGNLAFKSALTGRVPVSRVIALVALVVFALIGFALPVLVLAALAFAVLLLLSLAASGWFRLPSMNTGE
jgi:low temperature requirement protein LtrA